MTLALVDPTQAALDASDPARFLEQGPPPLPPIAPLISRHDVERDLAIALVVIAALVARDLLSNRPPSAEEAPAFAHNAWERHAPMWARLTVPAIRHTYVLGQVRGIGTGELDALATDYARELGVYVGESSNEALVEGLQAQLNQRWDFGLAWRRAASAYGVDKQQMRTYLASVATRSETSVEAVPASSRLLIDRLLLTRANRMAKAETFTAEQTGKTLAWMLRYQRGELDGAKRAWKLGPDERHCAVCLALAAQRVDPDQPFLIGDTQIWAPRAHPGCECRPELHLADGTIVKWNKSFSPAGVTVAGICLRASDTGRVLMIQRANDPKDPAGGMWEFPGGHLDEGEFAYQAARREWREEVHREFPAGTHRDGDWVHGIYQGFVLTIPREAMIATHERGKVINPDDPDGDEIEAIAWWDLDHLPRNVAVRPELRASMRKLRKACGVVAKARGDDPYDRDPHGRFAAMEQRRSSVQLAEMDPEIRAMLEQIERARPSLTEQSASLTSARTRPLTATRSLTEARHALTQSVALTQQGSLTRVEAQAPARQRASTSTIRLILPALPPPTEPRPEGEAHYVADWQVQNYYDEMWGGQIGGHFGTPMVHFGDMKDFYEEAALEDPVEEHQTSVQARLRPTPWAATGSQVDFYSEDEWDEMMAHARPVWASAVENAAEVLEEMSDSELRDVAARALRGDQHSSSVIRNMIVDNIKDRDAADHSLRDAYADYATFVRADLVPDGGAEFDRYMAVQPDRDIMESEVPVVFRFKKIGHDDNADDLTGSYLMSSGRYLSALAPGSMAPRGHLNLMEIELDPDSVG